MSKINKKDKELIKELKKEKRIFEKEYIAFVQSKMKTPFLHLWNKFSRKEKDKLLVEAGLIERLYERIIFGFCLEEVVKVTEEEIKEILKEMK